MPTRQQNKQRIRQTILGVATDLIAEQSLDTTTTRQIAKAAGISYQTLYNHFPSKAALVQAIIGIDAGAVARQIDDVIKHYDGDLQRTLSRINRVRLQYIDEVDRALWRAAAAIDPNDAHGEGDLHATDLIYLVDRARHERYYTLLSLAQGTGDLSHEVDLHLMAQTLHVLAQYMVTQYVFVPTAELEPLLRTLDEQTAQLITPYLRSRSGAPDARHPWKG